MKKQTCLRLPLVLQTIVVVLFVFSLGHHSGFGKLCYAQEPDQIKEALFQETQELFNSASVEGIPTFSPKNFARAQESYQQALRGYNKGERLEDIRKELQQAKTHLEAAFESARVVKVALENMIAMRAKALELAAKEHARNSFYTAEGEFRKAVEKAEEGNIRKAKRIAQKAEAKYRDAILVSIEDGLFKESKMNLKKARDLVTPDRYEESTQKLKKAEELLKQIQKGRIGANEFLELVEKMKFELMSTAYPDLTVKLWSVPKSQMKWSYLKWISPYPPVKDGLTTVSAVVENVGLADVDKSFTTELYVDGKVAKTWTFSPVLTGEGAQHQKNPLKPGDTYVCDYIQNFSEGKHTFHWKVDTKNDVKESDESMQSNELKASETWLTSSNLPDLIVADIFTDDVLLVGQKVNWKIKIENIGKTDVTIPFMTSLKSNGVQFGAFWLNSLAKGVSKTFEMKQNSGYKAGTETITGTVDVGGVIPEASEKNNILAKSFTTSYVDLDVQNLVVKPQQPVVHKPVTISFTVKNNGPGTATKPFKVRIDPGKVTKDKNQQFGTEAVLLDVPINKLPLKAGDSINLQHTVSLMFATDYQVSVIADFPGPNDPGFVYVEKPEDKANNTKTTKFHLKETYYVKIAKIEYYGGCKDNIDIWLDRSGGYWKGSVMIELMYQNKEIDFAIFAPLSPHKPVKGYSTKLCGKINQWGKKPWIANLTLVPSVYVGGEWIKSGTPPTTIAVPQVPIPDPSSIYPKSGKRGNKVSVTISGKGLVDLSGKAKLYFYEKNNGIKITTKQFSASTIKVELDIANNTWVGRRALCVEHCNGENSVSFYVTDNGSTPSSGPSTKSYNLQINLDKDICANYTKAGQKAVSKGVLKKIENLTKYNLKVFRYVGNAPLGEPPFKDCYLMPYEVKNLSLNSKDIANGWGASITDNNVTCDNAPSYVSFKITYEQ